MPPKTTRPPTPKKPAIIVDPVILKGTYVNHIQVSMTNNELIIDFFVVGPEPTLLVPGLKTHQKEVQIIHVHRAIASLSLAKGLATALANVVAEHESNYQIELPNSRTPLPDDKIKIWPLK